MGENYSEEKKMWGEDEGERTGIGKDIKTKRGSRRGVLQRRASGCEGWLCLEGSPFLPHKTGSGSKGRGRKPGPKAIQRKERWPPTEPAEERETSFQVVLVRTGKERSEEGGEWRLGSCV